MFRKAFSFGGLLLLAGATVLVTPGLGRAQHGGYGGGYRGGFGHGGYYRQSYAPRYGHRGFGGYGYYPYSYGGYTSDAYAYGSGGVTDDSGYYGSNADALSYYSDASSSPAPPTIGYQSASPAVTANSARLTVRVPAGARVWFDDTPTTATGPVRQYTSPPLDVGRLYVYEVRASWNENGREVIQTQRANVIAGEHVSVAFPIPSAQKR
jgi:uncharacterized protein (TIGR03000 family)